MSMESASLTVTHDSTSGHLRPLPKMLDSHTTSATVLAQAIPTDFPISHTTSATVLAQAIPTISAELRPELCRYLPPFVGNDYSCEYEHPNTYNSADLLWDGLDCPDSLKQCCAKGALFCKVLPKPTTDNIELRVCADEPRRDEDVYLETIVLSAILQ